MKSTRWTLFLASLAVACGAMLPVAKSDTITFMPICDLSWQSCCDCEFVDRCLNWDLPHTEAPACPEPPTILDDIVIAAPCQVDPPPAVDAIAGTITQSGGAFLLSGNLAIGTSATFDGKFIWDAGTLIRAEDPGVIVTINGGMDIMGSAAKFFGTDGTEHGGITLVNPATIVFTGTGDLTLGQNEALDMPAIIENQAGAVIDIQSNASILGTEFGHGTINNAGTIQKTGGDDVSEWTVNLVNTGLVDIQNGELHLLGEGTSSGEFRVGAGARLVLATQTPFVLEAGATSSGEGDLVVADTGDNDGVQIFDLLTLGQLTVEDSGRVGPESAADFGAIEISDHMNLTGATVFPPLTILAGATLNVNGPNPTDVGDLTIGGDAVIAGGELISTEHPVIIEAGASLELQDNAGLLIAGAASIPLENSGTVRKAGGDGLAEITTDFSAAFNNNAGSRIEVLAGTLAIDMDIASVGEVHVAADATLQASRTFTLNGGTLTGSGTVLADVNNVAAICAPGLSPGGLTIGSSDSPPITGNYTQGADATLSIEIGGDDPGVLYDQLIVSEAATLDGTLEITLIDGFVPADGSSFTILTAGSVSGVFATINETNLPDGVTSEVVYTDTTVEVQFAGTPIGDDNDNTNTNGNGNINDNVGDGNVDVQCGACGAGAATMTPLMLLAVGVQRLCRRRRK